MRKTKLLICDDEKDFRKGCAEQLPPIWEKVTGIKMECQECYEIVLSDAENDQKELSEVGKYDILLLDVMWENETGELKPKGIKIGEMVRSRFPELPIIIISYNVKVENFTSLVPLNLSGFISKNELKYKNWCTEIQTALIRAYEDSSGQALYKHIRELALNKTNWNIDLINEAASNVWRQQNPYGKWNAYWNTLISIFGKKGILSIILKMGKSFYETDLINLGVIPSMRGHLEHVLNVFFTGYVISHKLPSFRENVINAVKRLIPDSYIQEKDDYYWDLFQFAWITCSTLHDMGYCLESIHDLYRKYEEIIGLFPFIQLNQDHSNDITHVIDWKDKDWKEIKMSFQQILSVLNPGQIDSDVIIENINFEDNKSGITKFNHGIISGLQFLLYIKKHKSGLEQDLYKFLEWSASAMALHSLKPVGVADNWGIKYENDPLSYLLILCDELQIWNRERPDITDQSSLFSSIELERFEINDNLIQASVTYVPFKGDTPSTGEHYTQLVEELEKDNEMIMKFVKQDSIEIEIIYSIRGLDEEIKPLVLKPGM